MVLLPSLSNILEVVISNGKCSEFFKYACFQSGKFHIWGQNRHFILLAIKILKTNTT